MIGQTISHYKILEKLGEGGLGVVYLAEDTKLERKVAIKFLPHYVSTNSEEYARFKIEAKAAAALNDSNIATIYAIEEIDEKIFLVMEYIEGIELKGKIKLPISGGLSNDETIDIAIQIAEGLEAAHKKDIVHRDIKPQNIMIKNNGKVKIMDFGLAKIGKGTQVTGLGKTFGTTAYMSPEQILGGVIDHRTDIWSFGVVLYEMLTGKLPFKGDYIQAVSYSILNEEPEPILHANYTIPGEINKIVLKTLEKDVKNRYQQIHDLIHDLKSSRKKEKDTSSSNKEIKKLAVLPFSNIINDTQTNFLGFALSDQIIGAMAYSKNILVRPSSSVRKYQETIVDLHSAATDLKVEYILAGSYLKELDSIRLNIELIELKSEKMIWREPIEVKYKNAFELQDIITKKVVEQLEIEFSKEERERIKKDIPENPLAYEYYLRSLSYPRSVEENKYALEMLQKSIEVDPDYTPAYAEMGIRLYDSAIYEFEGEQKIFEAIKYLQMALKKNPEHLAAISNLALIYTETGNLEQSVELSRKYLEINPNNENTHFSLGHAYRYAGMLEESKKEFEKALELYPRNPRFRSAGITFIYLKEYKKAFEVLEYEKQSGYQHTWKGIAYLQMNEKSKAVEEFEKIILHDNNSMFAKYALGCISALKEDYKTAKEHIKEFEKSNPQDAEALYYIAASYGLIGNAEEASNVLKTAIDKGYFPIDFMVNDVSFNSIKEYSKIRELFNYASQKRLAFKKKFFS